MARKKLPFLRVDKTSIVDEAGRPVILKGVALGGWLMMEGYMLGGRNITESEFKKGFEKTLSKEALEDFTKSFRDTFIREGDIRIIKRWGANCIRIPFNHKLIESEASGKGLNEEGLSYLDRAVRWCEKHSLYCILDMHAAPGAQNPGWHSDCSDVPMLLANSHNRDRYVKLWHLLSGRYKDSSAVAGYDILNEPFFDISDEGKLKDLYEAVTNQIRRNDARHIIFLEGNKWSERLNFIGKPKDGNTAFSIHAYLPIDFTHNFERDLRYPGRIYGATWNKRTLETLAGPYVKIMKRRKVPFYIGEFGAHARGGYYGELKWVKDMIDIFSKSRWSWAYWTYKTVANSAFPDGVYRYLKNPPWVRHEGPIRGWENLCLLWPKEKTKIIESWKTENFTLNKGLFSILKKYF